MTKQLLNGKFAPMSYQIGFIETDCARAVEFYSRWQAELHSSRGVTIEQKPIMGELERALGALVPLTSVERRRHLFVPTNSAWTAYFDNGYRGPDVVSTMSYLAKNLRCRTLKVVNVPDTGEGKAKGRGRYGALELQMYGPTDQPGLNTLRTIHLSNQGDKWEFVQTGTPFDFERTEQYAARKIRDRFSLETLVEYVGALGLQPFEQSFYLPATKSEAILIEKLGPHNPNMKEFSLEEVRALYV